MPPVTVWLAIALPLFLTAGAIAAIHFNREHERRVERGNAWRDTSLDDWRRDRDALIESERQQRQANGGGSAQDSAGRAEAGEEEQPVRQQRLGG